MEKSKAMAPMTKEEWEQRQSVVKRVIDEETGRYRLSYLSDKVHCREYTYNSNSNYIGLTTNALNIFIVLYGVLLNMGHP